MAFDNPFSFSANARMLQGLSGGAILSRIKEMVADGEGIMQADPVWGEIDQNQDYIGGRQKARMISEDRPEYVSHAVVNEVKRTHRRHISALTDVKPTYSFHTANPNFQTHGMMLNQLTTVWWINTFADLALADAASYAFAGGSGDLVLDYNPFYGPQGDMVLSARDARDTIPVLPARQGGIQDWGGVILREAHNFQTLRGMYPEKVEMLKQSTSPWGGGLFTKFKMGMNRITGGGATSTLSGLAKTYTGQSKMTGNEVLLYKVYLKDLSINTTDHPVGMGTPGTNWYYEVPTGGRLYPNKRLIVCTEAGVLSDGPNPYWHGMFPVARLKLMTVPWSYFGVPLVDVMVQSGLQDAANNVLNAMLDKIRQRNRPPMIGNARVPEQVMKRFDLLKPNARMRTNEQVGTGVSMPEIPDLPAFTFELWQALRTALHDVSGDSTLDARQAAAANQSFDPASIEAWMNALSPELKLEGRQVELCLREIAEMQKSSIFQFYSLKRRLQILGDGGQTLQDFDMDPGNMIPAMQKGDPGYTEELDAERDQKSRGEFFAKMFTFYVTPNSLLALNANAEKLKYLQMMRGGLCDVWTFWEKMEIPNAGKPPLMMLPMAEQPPPEIMQMIGQINPETGDPMVPGTAIDPMTGQAMSLREPLTITERLQAQAMLGLGMGGGPAGASNPNQAGRKATGQAPPSVDVQKTADGGNRIKLSESPGNHKPSATRKMGG